jgi:hypothetical protein
MPVTQLLKDFPTFFLQKMPVTQLLKDFPTFLLEKPPVTQLLKDFPISYGTQRFITVFTGAYHWFPPQPNQSIPHNPILSL